MTYSAAEARQELLSEVAHAIDELGIALTALGDAYELLDDSTADKLEGALFAPVQSAYGKAKRTHTEFAGRHGLHDRAFVPGAGPAPSIGAQGMVDRAVLAVEAADQILSELQDSMAPVEVGDRELRADLSEVRTVMAKVGPAARDFSRLRGR